MARFRRLTAAFSVLFVSAFAASSDARADTPEGRWLTEAKDGVVEVYRCGEALCGRLVWFRMRSLHSNPQALDLHNPTEALRNRSLCGLMILSSFRPAGRDHWGDGSAYDPDSGHSYSAEMAMKADGHLSLRGYIGISLFGRSEEWTRYNQPITRCPAE